MTGSRSRTALARPPKRRPALINNCPITEPVTGRCLLFLPDGRTCARHKDVRVPRWRYIETGQLTNESDLPRGAKDEQQTYAGERC
jgi:hypothetical protein